jgi:murein DD-endopeptidase MepM/ murein hydrolase activator NlpD
LTRLPFDAKHITAHYGEMSAFRRSHGMQAHSGTDFAPPGSNRGRTKVASVSAGTIKMIQWSDVLGWVIVQTVWDLIEKKTLYVGYSHISCNNHGMNCKGPKVEGPHAPVNKKVGSRVKEGQTMAYMGNTGTGSNGVHLHLTLSRTLKGVFGATSAKMDFVPWQEKQAVARKAISKRPVIRMPAPTPVHSGPPNQKTSVKYCTCCKRPL